MPSLPPLPVEDREHILRHTADAWRDLAKSRFFITGGTGFFGKWMLEAIAAANDELGADVHATILSRDPRRFADEVPHLARRQDFDWVVGEPAAFEFPAGRYDYLIDFATPSAAVIAAGGSDIAAQCLDGTGNLLRFARHAGIRRILYASSGAVYGRQPPELERIGEDFRGDPDTISPYGRLKQRTETLLLDSGVDCVIARGYAFIGPYLPLTEKFAAGSFLRDALAGGPIRIHGNGTPIRSYLYAADLAVWLTSLLVHARTNEAYNLGSGDPVTMRDLAQAIATGTNHPVQVAIGANMQDGACRYLPEIRKATHNLGLKVRIELSEAISRTLNWARSSSRLPVASL